MEVLYKRHGFPKIKADKEEPEESDEPEVGYVVAVNAGAEVNKSYAVSDGEDDEDGEGEGAAAAATPTARLRLLMPLLQMQRRRQQLRLWPKRPRLDLCAMHCIKTLPCKICLNANAKCSKNRSHSETI